MPALTCTKCKKEIDRSNSEGGYCMECVLSMGADMASKRLSKEDLKRLKAAVEAEIAGLMSTEMLKGILEDMYVAIEDGNPFAEAVDSAAVQVQRLAGLGMAREMLKVTQALGSMALEQEEEIRSRIRRLSALGEKT